MDKAYPYKRLKNETALGATKVLEALRKAQIPVVVHNGLPPGTSMSGNLSEIGPV